VSATLRTIRRVNLLGRPTIETQQPGFPIRSRKSWALLAYLLLSHRAPTRRELASLLFARADDPLAALRWTMSDVRRALGADAVIAGDPVKLQLSSGVVVDVSVVLTGPSDEAIHVQTLGSELLEGLSIPGAFDFESWLLGAQRRVGVATVEVLREAAEAAVSRGDYESALGHAVRLSTLARLDEHTHAMLVALYRLVGDDLAARRQYTTGANILHAELGVSPGQAMRSALCQPLPRLLGEPGSGRPVLTGPTRHGNAGAAVPCG